MNDRGAPARGRGQHGAQHRLDRLARTLRRKQDRVRAARSTCARAIWPSEREPTSVSLTFASTPAASSDFAAGGVLNLTGRTFPDKP